MQVILISLKHVSDMHFWMQVSYVGAPVVLHLHSLKPPQVWSHWLEDVVPPLQEANVPVIPQRKQTIKMHPTSKCFMSRKIYINLGSLQHFLTSKASMEVLIYISQFV
jgi:hypothetical protein